MVKEMILKADFQPVTQISENKAKLMFFVEDVKNPVYQKDGEGYIEYDENGNPIITGYEDTDYCDVLCEYYKGRRTEAAMRKLIENWYNPEIDAKILRGFRWNDKPVWLSSENQFNFKAAYDLALQTQGQSLPVTFKLGEDNSVPVYYTFEDMTEFTDFYTKAIAFINQTLNEGWQKKDGFDWSLYVDTEAAAEE